MYYFSKANILLGMHFNKAIVVSMPVIYCFIETPQDYSLKIIYYYSQQFEYSLQSMYWNSAAIVMYSKMGLKEETGWCRRGWRSRSQRKLAPCTFSCPHPLSWICSLTLWHQVTMQEAGPQTQSCELGLLGFRNSETSVPFLSEWPNLWYSITVEECS